MPSFCADNRLCRILLLYIPGCSWQWLPEALLLLLYVPFKTLFQWGTDLENSLYSNDSLISCFLAFVVFATEMCVQILIKKWLSLYCLFPLTVPLDWTPANRAIYFPLSSFFSFLSLQKSIQRFFGSLLQKPVDFCLHLRSSSSWEYCVIFHKHSGFLVNIFEPPKKANFEVHRVTENIYYYSNKTRGFYLNPQPDTLCTNNYSIS